MSERNDRPIACDLSALTPDEQARRERALKGHGRLISNSPFSVELEAPFEVDAHVAEL